ncbi:MAG: DNA repair protein RecO [Clostridiaceae bacterium]|nr:DNA repair protein RecO [Clostridiaceae bacterium]
MDNIKLNALCVRSTDYSESDKIITLISAERGKIGVYARGVKKPSAKLKFAAAPFCFGEYMLAQGKGGGFILADCAEGESFFGLSSDIARYYAGFTVLEAADKLSNEIPNVPLLKAALTALTSLSYGGGEAKTLLRFITDVLAASGYLLNFDACAVCGGELSAHAYFDFSAGAVCGECRPKDGLTISRGALAALKEVCSAHGVVAGSVDGACDAEALELALMIMYGLTGVKLLSASEYLRLRNSD